MKKPRTTVTLNDADKKNLEKLRGQIDKQLGISLNYVDLIRHAVTLAIKQNNGR